MANYLIIGGTGFIGKHLTRHLIDKGDVVVVKTRDAQKAKHHFAQFGSQPTQIIASYDELKQSIVPDYIISLAGAGIVDKRWTKARKQELIDSRVKPLIELQDFYCKANTHNFLFLLIHQRLFYCSLSSSHNHSNHHKLFQYMDSLFYSVCRYSVFQFQLTVRLSCQFRKRLDRL